MNADIVGQRDIIHDLFFLNIYLGNSETQFKKIPTRSMGQGL